MMDATDVLLAQSITARLDRRAIDLAAKAIDRRLAGVRFGGGGGRTLRLENAAAGYGSSAFGLVLASGKIMAATLYTSASERPLQQVYDPVSGLYVWQPYGDQPVGWASVELFRVRADGVSDPPQTGNNPQVSLLTGTSVVLTLVDGPRYITTPGPNVGAPPLGWPSTPSSGWVTQVYVRDASLSTWFSTTVTAGDLLSATFTVGGSPSWKVIGVLLELS